MEKINERTRAEVLFKFRWASEIGEHEETYYCRINPWRDMDLFPPKMKTLLWEKTEGEKFTTSFKKGELIPFSEKNIIEVEKVQFLPQKPYRASLAPRLGRFYPLGFFIGLEGVFPENFKPARVVGIQEKTLLIDTNVPIGAYDIELEVEVLSVTKKSADIGGECRDWCAISLENGPGMQIRYNGLETDFELENPESFTRQDEGDDTDFYSEPRITTHIDSKCHENLMEVYDKILPKEGKILDLMSSFQSHIPKNEKHTIVGLGLNKEEMEQNKILDSFLIADLNKNPQLPFGEEEFDAVVCDLSIEYITKPFELLGEIKRILKSNGIFTVSFSNRYFPTKVIKLWIDLHEFERMGYVLELLLRSGGFKNFKTFSMRGFRRPYDDKYFGCTLFSDPLYVVYAQKE
ncbi:MULTISPECIES: methyltransferase domain-containing protein [Thermodesulfovibrio]|jgi:SAM-dependent methyltransferase|uniref:methyltransferase domain-containing protein n=1 Tax=Thermodesulfovibrio TaxID=28261 RepID=UPI00260A813F|nr:methyltransferase domain-containing protein [Thermodesulfovibrio sp.]